MWDYLSPLDVVTMFGYAPPGRTACERNRFGILYAVRARRTSPR